VDRYLDASILSEFVTSRNNIYSERTKIWKKYNIDILDTDNLSSLQIYDIVSQYDKNYNINFSRNGEDAKSNQVSIEQKCAKVNSNNQKCGFMFHAMGDLIYSRYIFAVRRKDTLELLRIYDISSESNIKLIHNELNSLKEIYLKDGFRKYDGIFIKEKFLIDNIIFKDYPIINACKISVDNIIDSECKSTLIDFMT
jgi:hypothetical protein